MVWEEEEDEESLCLFLDEESLAANLDEPNTMMMGCVVLCYILFFCGLIN